MDAASICSHAHRPIHWFYSNICLCVPNQLVFSHFDIHSSFNFMRRLRLQRTQISVLRYFRWTENFCNFVLVQKNIFLSFLCWGIEYISNPLNTPSILCINLCNSIEQRLYKNKFKLIHCGKPIARSKRKWLFYVFFRSCAHILLISSLRDSTLSAMKEEENLIINTF